MRLPNDRMNGMRDMSQLYFMSGDALTAPSGKAPQGRLSQRAAILAITALSLLLWSPILLPFTALLHR